MLSEKTLKAITKLYDKVDFKETAIALDPNHEASIFAKGADRKATEEDMLDLYVEILKLTNDRNVEMLDRGKEFMDELTPEVVSKFFKSIVKMLEKLWFLVGALF
jgi:hypothetical protein